MNNFNIPRFEFKSAWIRTLNVIVEQSIPLKHVEMWRACYILNFSSTGRNVWNLLLFNVLLYGFLSSWKHLQTITFYLTLQLGDDWGHTEAARPRLKRARTRVRMSSAWGVRHKGLRNVVCSRSTSKRVTDCCWRRSTGRSSPVSCRSHDSDLEEGILCKNTCTTIVSTLIPLRYTPFIGFWRPASITILLNCGNTYQTRET